MPPSYSGNPVLWKMLLLAFSGIIALVACYLVTEPPHLHSGWKIEVSLVGIITLGGFFAFSLPLFRTPYLFTSAYLLALGLFHLGITIPESLGLIQVSSWYSWPSEKWLAQAGWYTVLAVACVGVGFSLSVAHSRLGRLHKKVDLETKSRVFSMAFRDGVGLLLASFVMFGIAVASFGNLLAYSRVDFFRGVGDTRGLGVFLMIFPSAITLLIIGAQTRRQHLFAWALFVFGIVLLMLSGYRTSALYPLLIGAVVWVKMGRRIPTIYAICSVVIIIMAISAVGILRAYKYQEINVNKIAQSFQAANTTDIFRLGQTGGLLAHVLRLVPGTDPYRYGGTYVQYFLASVPNLSLTQNESARAIALREKTIDPKAISRTVPSDWLTYRLIPEKFKLGEGVGFTGIGEPYLNFGLPGVVLFFLLIGYSLGRLDQINFFQHPALLFFASAILWHLVRTVRDDFGNFIKPMIFTYLILFFWRMLLAMFFRSRLNKL